MGNQFVVCIVIPSSDFPGVEATYGPFDKDEAEAVAFDIYVQTGFKRGEEVQISMIQPFNSDTFDSGECWY